MSTSKITPITAKEVRSHGYGSLFNKHIGINTTPVISDPQSCAVNVIPQEITSNASGIVHGGWTATLLDTVASGVVYSNQSGGLENEEYGLTASLNIEFRKPLFIGGTYLCEGEIIKREGNNIQTRATVTDDKGTEVATATALVKARRPNYKPV